MGEVLEVGTFVVLVMLCFQLTLYIVEQKLGVVAHTYTLSTPETEAGA